MFNDVDFLCDDWKPHFNNLIINKMIITFQNNEDLRKTH